MPAAAPSALKYEPQLDGLRALAVVLILVFHRFGTIFPGGFIGVDVFFVLSGYLITGILLAEIARTGRVSLARFYWRRALRLLPALFVVCTITGIATLIFPQIQERSATQLGIVAAVTYTASPLAATGHDLGAFTPTWSLSVEEYFYLGWPMLLLLLTRFGRRGLEIAIGSLTLIAALYSVAAWHLLHFSEIRMAYAPDTRFVQLLIGCCLATAVARARLRLSWPPAFAAMCGLAAFVLMSSGLSPSFYFGGGSLLVALAALCVILHLVSEPHTWLSRLLSTGPATWIGKRSYGIYLWNLPIVAMVNLVELPYAVQSSLKVVLSFAIPALSFVVVEKPLLKMKARFAPGGSNTRAGEREVAKPV
jgi:peptidoglycan/LPS O-acetylase OafA/YrhL